MTLWLVWRNLRVRQVATLLTLVGIALATATAVVVPLISKSLQKGAADAAQVFDLLITAKGSPTQAVLSNLYLLEPPIANIPESVYQDLKNDPRSRLTIPLGFGDSYRGFPLIGTSAQVFELRIKPSLPPYFRLASGRAFSTPEEVVLGAKAARETGLRLGSDFISEHGFFSSQQELADSGQHHQAHPYKVAGILEPTGGPWDRGLLLPIEAYWQTHSETTQARQVTAVLFTGKRLVDIYNVAQQINRSQNLQAVFPGQVFARNREFLSQGESFYRALSVLVLLMAGMLIWQGVFSRGLERRRTNALLRGLGAGRGTVFGLVLLETLLEVSLGVLLGIGLGWTLAWLASGNLGERLGFYLPPPQLTWNLVSTVIWLIPFGLLAALPPAWQSTRESPLEHL